MAGSRNNGRVKKRLVVTLLWAAASAALQPPQQQRHQSLAGQKALRVRRGGGATVAYASNERRRRPRTDATDLVTGATVAGGLAQCVWPKLTQWGAKHAPSVAAGQWWRLFTPMLLHGGLAHIGLNLFSLRSVGPDLERWYGPERTLGVYVAAGAAGNAFSCVFSPVSLSVGASGAVCGLVGALAVHYARHHHIFGDRSIGVLENISKVVVVNALVGLLPGSGIDNWAHLGGFLGGAATGYLIGCRFTPQRDRLGRVRKYQDTPLLPVPTFFPRS